MNMCMLFACLLSKQLKYHWRNETCTTKSLDVLRKPTCSQFDLALPPQQTELWKCKKWLKLSQFYRHSKMWWVCSRNSFTIHSLRVSMWWTCDMSKVSLLLTVAASWTFVPAATPWPRMHGYLQTFTVLPVWSEKCGRGHFCRTLRHAVCDNNNQMTGCCLWGGSSWDSHVVAVIPPKDWRVLRKRQTSKQDYTCTNRKMQNTQVHKNRNILWEQSKQLGYESICRREIR